jgi:hypothetical protein
VTVHVTPHRRSFRIGDTDATNVPLDPTGPTALLMLTSGTGICRRSESSTAHLVIEIDLDGHDHIVRCRGELDLTTTELLLDALNVASVDDRPHVVIDLEAVTFLDAGASEPSWRAAPRLRRR